MQKKSWWIIMLLTFTFQHVGAHITLPDTNMEVEPGKSYSIEVPDVTIGWVDYAKWTCNSSYIIFQSQENYGAYVKIDKKFSGTAKIELLFVEKWYDNRGWTQQRTYLKNYILISKGGGDSGENVDPTRITLTSEISVYLDETKSINYSLQPSGATSDVTWWSDDASIAEVSSSGRVTGMKVGTTKVWAKTSKGGLTDYCKVTVSEPLLKMVSSSPSDEEKDVSFQVHPSVRFNISLFEGSAFSQISLKEDMFGERVPGKVSLQGKTLYFEPTEDLQPSTTYVLNIPQNAVNNKWNTGNAEQVLIRFATLTEPLLKMVSSSPADQEKNVPYQAHLSVKFNLLIFEGPAFDQITLKGDNSYESVPGKLSLSGSTLKFVPDKDLEPTTTYVLTIPRNAITNKWHTGNAEEVLVSFSTIPEPLIEKVSTSPSDQAKNVLPQIHPSVHFSMPIFEGPAFSQVSLMEDQTNKRVSGKVALQGLMLYFVPSEDLQPFTSYVLNIPQNAVKNERNKGNAAQVLVRFTTGVNPKDVKYFLVWDKQGGCVSFLLEERPRITYDLDNALIHCVTAKQDMDFSMKEVHKYTLEVVSDPQTGIGKVVADTNVKGDFLQQPNTLLFENFSRGTQVRVYSINGRLLQSYQVDGHGQLAISTQNWELGVYLIHTGSATYKIIKK